MKTATKTATKFLDFTVTKVSKKDASGECLIEGYANTSTKDRVGDVVLPSAFEKCLPTYLKNPVLLMNHDWNDVAGVTLSAEINDKGLYVKARVSDTREDVKTLIREGCLRTFSIGYNEIDADMDEGTKTKIVKELELLEISIVSVPANTEAMFTAIAAKDTAEGSEKNEDKKQARTAGQLKEYISMVKSAVGNNLGDDGLMAVIDYFNSNEGELMTKEELLAKLRAKAAEAKPAADAAKPADQAKADEGKPADGAAAAGDDVLKQLMAKLDAMAEAMAQMFEKINAMSAKPAEEEKPADDGKADDKPAEEEKPMKEDEEEKEEDDAEDKEDDAKEEDDEKELDVAAVDSEIAQLEQQIQQLEDAENA